MIYPALKPLWYQLPSWYARSKGVRFEINSIHRRGGKDVHHFCMAVQDAIEKGGTHRYCFPTRTWAEEAIFKEQFTIGRETRFFWEWCIPKNIKAIKKEKDCSILFPHNNGRIQLMGTDDGTFVGRGGKGYTLSEFSKQKSSVTAFIIPILDQSGGYLRMNGTLRGRDNHLWDVLQRNKNNPEWFTQWLRPQQTKCYCWVGGGLNINPELLDRIGEIGPNYTKIINVQDRVDSGLTSMANARQEYLNEPVAAFEKGYYTYEMDIAKGEKRIFNNEIKYNPSLPVFTFWDLGKGTTNSTDAMSCWFVQVPNGDFSNPSQVNLIDYHESRGRDWAFYAQMLNSRGYWYGNHYAPWDIAKGMAGHEKTNRDYARERGVIFQTVSRNAKLSLDIEDCRRFWVNVSIGNTENCIVGTELLMAYHEKKNSFGSGTGVPVHDNTSNCADAFRTMARAFTTNIVESNMGQGNMDWADNIKMDGYFD